MHWTGEYPSPTVGHLPLSGVHHGLSSLPHPPVHVYRRLAGSGLCLFGAGRPGPTGTFCGRPGGKLAKLADVAVIAPSDRIGQQEDVHMILDHCLSFALLDRIKNE